MHCRAGVSRSTAAAALILMQANPEWPASAAGRCCERRLRTVALGAFRGNPAEIHSRDQGAARRRRAAKRVGEDREMGLFKSEDAQSTLKRFGFIASPSEPFHLFVWIKTPNGYEGAHEEWFQAVLVLLRERILEVLSCGNA